jgi:RNA polymerase sigma-70 factor (ECF subfamily)
MEGGATGSTGATGAAASVEVLLGQREWLGRMAASLVEDAARADDLVQRALLAALERPPERASHPRAWLGTVVRRLVRADDRSDMQRLERERRAPTPTAPAPPDEIVAQAALQHEMSAAVLALEEPYRTAVLLRYASDLAPRAIAARTGAPVETVRTRIKRGVEMVRANLLRARGNSANAAAPALAWLGLVEGGTRRTLRRALLAKPAATAAGSGTAAATAAGVVGALGVLGMSTKVKLAAALVVAAAGTFAVVKLGEPRLPPLDGASQAAGSHVPALPTPASPESPLPAPATATRVEEAERAPDTARVAPTDTAFVGAVVGVVRTAKGDPAPGAAVLLAEAGSDSPLSNLHDLCGSSEELLGTMRDDPRAPKRVLAGADGSFRFDDLAAGLLVNVAALHREEGTALASGVRVERAPATSVELVLAAGVVIGGRVTDEQGVPIPTATVALHRFQRHENGSSTQSMLSLPVDAEGRFRTIPLPFRGFAFDASAPGFLTGRLPPVELPEAAREHRADFQLARSRTLRGRLLAPDGTAARLTGIAELEVILSSVDPRGATRPRDSYCEDAALDREESRWEATPRSAEMKFVSVWSRDSRLGAAEVPESGPAPDVVVDLSKLPKPTPRATLVVEAVRAGDGAAIPEFELRLSRDPTSALDPAESTKSREIAGKAGRAEIPELEAGGWELTLRAEGFVPRFAVARVAAAGSKVRFELVPANARVAGRVQDDAGRPVERAKVFLLGPDGRVAAPWPECAATSDGAGRFAFEKIAAGDYRIVAEADGFASASAAAVAASGGSAGDETTVVVTLRAGFEMNIDPVAFAKGGETRVEGPFMFRIRDEAGALVRDDHRCPGWLTTMAGSGFPVRLAPGRYTVEVYCPRFEIGSATFNAAPKSTVRVELVPLDPDREE